MLISEGFGKVNCVRQDVKYGSIGSKVFPKVRGMCKVGCNSGRKTAAAYLWNWFVEGLFTRSPMVEGLYQQDGSLDALQTSSRREGVCPGRKYETEFEERVNVSKFLWWSCV